MSLLAIEDRLTRNSRDLLSHSVKLNHQEKHLYRGSQGGRGGTRSMVYFHIFITTTSKGRHRTWWARGISSQQKPSLSPPAAVCCTPSSSFPARGGTGTLHSAYRGTQHLSCILSLRGLCLKSIRLLFSKSIFLPLFILPEPLNRR